LYVSFNEIDDLFDISFLEHLTVLDLEGNNIHSVEQLSYLKRLQCLQDLNLKQNPVSKLHAEKYLSIVKECPTVTCMDDQAISDFESAIAKQAKVQLPIALASDVLVQRFIRLGI
jgi:Leucine-rich repeat (LRR) protein